MKRVQTKKLTTERSGNISLNLAIMIVFLLCGVATGCIFSIYPDNICDIFLSDSSLEEIAVNGASSYSFWQTYFNLVKYPAIVFLLGFTAFGIFIIPIAVSIKGFFIAFSVSSVIQMLGAKGFFSAISMFGLQTAVSIPCLLLTAACAFEMSKLFINVIHRPKGSFSVNHITFRTYTIFFVISAVLLIAFTLLDVALTPTFVSLATKNIF